MPILRGWALGGTALLQNLLTRQRPVIETLRKWDGCLGRSRGSGDFLMNVRVLAFCGFESWLLNAVEEPHVFLEDYLVMSRDSEVQKWLKCK